MTNPLNKRFGNRFWEARASSGRHKIFATPNELWEACEEYFNYVTDNPEIVVETKKVTRSLAKDGLEDHDTKELVETETKSKEIRLPFTFTGLCLFLGVSESYFRMFRHAESKKLENKELSEEKRKESEDFLTVLEKVEKILYDQKLQGAMSGYFKEGITIRVLGLKDVTESTNVNINRDATPLTKEETQQIYKDIMNEI